MTTDTFTVRLVVAILGVFALIALGGLVWLVQDGTPGAELAIISTPMGLALGAVAGILAKTSTVPDQPPAAARPAPPVALRPPEPVA